jgi:phosphonate transport system permease protein
MIPRLPAIGAADIQRAKALAPGAFGPGPRGRALMALAWIAGIVGTLAVMVVFDVSPERIWRGLGELWRILLLMLPPNPGAQPMDLVRAVAETLAMAFLGTLIAAVLAVPLGFMAARNVIPAWVLRVGARRFSDCLRGVDQLVWALIFVRAVGLGPLAGVLAIVVSDTGTLAKLFSEAIENVDRKPMDGVRAAGGGRLHVIRFGILPQVLPMFLSSGLYIFESNTRSATILGIVGAGGIGFHLADRIRALRWDEASFIILLILVVVGVIDLVSRKLRAAAIGREQRSA